MYHLLKRTTRFVVFLFLAGFLLSCSKSAVQAPQKDTPLCYRSATELTRAIRNKEISSLELLNIYLDRIERYNGRLNAVVAMDIEAARTRARAADEALARGENWGPLHGLPMTVKDTFEAVGMPATSGDPVLKDYIPEKNAIAVQKLVDAGAIVFGKTNVPYHAMDVQSYNEIYGTTNNPWNPRKTAGGSSGGSAAALATGFTPLELGSDIGGSLRTPSHFNGVFGHKPTFGLVLRQGHIPPMPPGLPPEVLKRSPLWVVGPLARSADDLELALDLLVGQGSGDSETGSTPLLPPRHEKISDYRVAVWLADPIMPAGLDYDVWTLLHHVADRLKAAGVHVDMQARPEMTFNEIAEVYRSVYDALAERKLPLNPDLQARQQKLRDVMADFFKQYDVILAPVTPTPAFDHNHEGTFESRKIIINGQSIPMFVNIFWPCIAVAAELPATAAPAGLTDSGMPVGVQIIGARNEDKTTIDFARGLSKLIGGFKIPPGYEK